MMCTSTCAVNQYLWICESKMNWWKNCHVLVRWNFPLMFKPVQLVAKPSTCDKQAIARLVQEAWRGLSGSRSQAAEIMDVPNAWKEDGRVDVWSFTYICYNCNCYLSYLLVYAFFLFMFVISVCQPLSHLLTSIAYVHPPISLSITLCLYAPWGYAPFGGTATETNSGHRPVDEPWQNKRGPWRGHWWLVFLFQGWLFEDCQKLMGSPIPLKKWRFFFDTQVATRNGLSTFEVQGQVEVPGVFELAALPTMSKMSKSWVRCACSGTKPATPVPWCSVELNPRRWYGSLGKPTLENR